MSEPQRASTLPVVAVLIAGVVVMIGLVAWSTSASDEDTAATSLCGAYGELLASADVLRAADPASSSAADATEFVDVYLDQVQSLRIASDGRYASQIDALDAAVADVQRTLASVQDDEPYDTWAPLVEDDVEAALDAAAAVHEAVGPSCTPPDL